MNLETPSSYLYNKSSIKTLIDWCNSDIINLKNINKEINLIGSIIKVFEKN